MIASRRKVSVAEKWMRRPRSRGGLGEPIEGGIEGRIEECAFVGDLASTTRDCAVDHVEECGGDADEAGDQEVAGGGESRGNDGDEEARDGRGIGVEADGYESARDRLFKPSRDRPRGPICGAFEVRSRVQPLLARCS